jgi:hypothetical protein
VKRVRDAFRAFYCILRGGSVMVNVVQVYDCERVLMRRPHCFSNVQCRVDLKWDRARNVLVEVVPDDDAAAQAQNEASP